LEEVIDMLKIKTIVILLFVIPSVFGNDNSDMFDKLKKYLFFNYSHISYSERVDEVDNIGMVLDENLKLTPYSVKDNMLKGLQQYANIYANEKLKKNEIKTFKLNSQKFLKIALEENKTERELSLLELEVIRTYSGPELVPLVVDEIVGTQKSYEEKDIVELKRSKIDNLIRLGRFGEARDEMIETNQEHPAFKSTEWDEAFEGQILEVQAKLKATQEKEADTPIEKPEEKPIKNEVVAANATVNEEIKPKVLTEESSPILIQFKSVLEQYGIFILAFLVFLGMYFFSNRKSKKQ
jgi:hypothetical protein